MYNKIKVLLLSNNDNSMELYNWLKQAEDVIIENFKDKLTIEYLKIKQPDIIISYNYKYIISENMISFINNMNVDILNMHISYLPWNKGSDPNFWSFIDDTPKGVTIHRLEKGLDSGDILYQKLIKLDARKETFQSSYNRLNEEIISLFCDNWEDIKYKNYKLIKQQEKGSYHKHKELQEIQTKVPFKWEDNIAKYIEKYNEYYRHNNMK